MKKDSDCMLFIHVLIHGFIVMWTR